MDKSITPPPPSSASSPLLALTPLGAGDLIDRAIRLYRNNFWTFVWLASPPILLGTLVSVAWTALSMQLFASGDPAADAYDNYVASWFFSALGNSLIWMIEGVATLVVMGGASRNFVRHLLFGEPISFRETYRNVRSRLGALVGGSALITFLLSLIGLIIFYFGFFVMVIVVSITVMALYSTPFLATIFSVVFGLGVAFGTGWLFFLVASRFAYVPQAITVEGLGVFAAVGRSANLASGNVKRIYALFIFTVLATYAALSLLYIPLGWYAYASGVEVFSFNQNTIPLWYLVAYQVISQLSLILLMPVWMVGLCLLYVDERVRHEGYDIELMAARQLGEIPPLPQQYRNPLQPALAGQFYQQQQRQQEPAPKNSPITTLGLR